MPERENIRRIGRVPNPAERGFQVTMEHREVLDRLSQGYFGRAEGVSGRVLWRRWDEISEAERDHWRKFTIERARQFAAEYVSSAQPQPPLPPDPEPSYGESHPRLVKLA